jgi:drug/metabolite transporter (DMT)-like permease
MPAAAASVDLVAEQRRGRAFVALAALAWSTAGVLQRALTVGTPTQLAGRAFFTVTGLLLYIAVAERGHPVRGFRAIGRDGLGIAALMAISSASFITALNHTTVANVLFMQALAPIIAAALAAIVLGEAVTRRTALSMALAIVGVAAMVGGPGKPNGLGGGLAFLMCLSFAATLVLARRGRDVSMAPATCLSQAIILLAFSPFGQPSAIGGQDLLLLCLLGFGQMGLGLIFLTIGARLIPAAEVALISLLEIVLGPLWVWVARSEQPGTGTIVGGSIVLAAVLIQSLPGASAPQSTVEYPR